MMVSLPKVFVYDPFRTTQPEGTHSPPPCNLMRESYAYKAAAYRARMQKATQFCEETCMKPNSPAPSRRASTQREGELRKKGPPAHRKSAPKRHAGRGPVKA